ncbi:MAG: family 78 glycoside hydrolase catalytic domain, partial [Planctomycetales bacterium]|nr:family 78 glycoside hydrolase catalytic domain [Planctomycetales bacterium]
PGERGSFGACNIPDPWFRKRVRLPSPPKVAELAVASVGYHELYVNGVKASDAVLAPAVSDHTKRARYVTYDIAPLLSEGENVIGLWLGTSWSIYPEYQSDDRPREPLVIAQGNVDCGTHGVVEIATDESWRTSPSPSRLFGCWDFMKMGGELYDANLEQPGWGKPGFDDTGWQAAVVRPCELKLSAEMLEPNRCFKRIEPVAVERLEDGVYRIDMGVNFSGWLELELTGEPGGRVLIDSSELEDVRLTHRLHSEYVLGPAGKGKFQHRFNYHCGRWVTVEGVTKPPRVEDVVGRMVRSDFKRTSSFASSNDLINRVYETTLWTLENLSLGGYIVDCPHRERMGYGGDAHSTIGAALSNYAVQAFYTKWNVDWHDVQGPDGWVAHTAPTYWGGGGPAWSGFVVTLPWEFYLAYGDRRILEQSFAPIERWLAFCEANTQDDMLVRWGNRRSSGNGDGNSDGWAFLGDWLWPKSQGVNSHTRETLFFNNCFWVHNLDVAASIAQTLGRDEQAATWSDRAQKARRALHSAYFNSDDATYSDDSQVAIAMALVAKVPPKELEPKVWESLERQILVVRDGHIYAGITGSAFLLKLLMESGRDDLIFAMATQEDYPSWGDMLNKGATTIWESWDERRGSGGSKLHSSYLAIAQWPIEGLAGIRPKPGGMGYGQFFVAPADWGDSSPDWVRASLDTDYGRIEVDLKRGDASDELQVVVPPNTTATIVLRATADALVLEGGNPVHEAEGILGRRRMGTTEQIDVAPGSYRFSVTGQGPVRQTAALGVGGQVD